MPTVCDLTPRLRMLQVGEMMNRLPPDLDAIRDDHPTRHLNRTIRLFLAERRSMPSTDPGIVQ